MTVFAKDTTYGLETVVKEFQELLVINFKEQVEISKY